MEHQSQLLEFNLTWIINLLVSHGPFIKSNSIQFQPVLRSIQKIITRIRHDIGRLCDENI